MKSRIILLAAASVVIGLSACKKSEKKETDGDAKKVTATAVSCQKKGQLLNSAGTACVSECAEGEVTDETHNKCMTRNQRCGKNQRYEINDDGDLVCKTICPADAELDKDGLCKCKDEKKKMVENMCVLLDDIGGGDECGDGEVKDKEGQCVKATGDVCRELGGHLSSDAKSCVSACPTGEKLDPDPAINQCKTVETAGDAFKEREAEFNKIQDKREPGNFEWDQPAISMGVYEGGKVLKKAGGTAAYVSIKSLKITFSENMGPGPVAVFYPRDGIFAKRAGWVFLRMNRQASTAGPYDVKVWVGCLDEGCKRLGFKVEDVTRSKVFAFEKAL